MINCVFVASECVRVYIYRQWIKLSPRSIDGSRNVNELHKAKGLGQDAIGGGSRYLATITHWVEDLTINMIESSFGCVVQPSSWLVRRPGPMARPTLIGLVSILEAYPVAMVVLVLLLLLFWTSQLYLKSIQTNTDQVYSYSLNPLQTHDHASSISAHLIQWFNKRKEKRKRNSTPNGRSFGNSRANAPSWWAPLVMKSQNLIPNW